MAKKTTDSVVAGVLARARPPAVQLVRFLYCANDNVIRGKACHTDLLAGYLRSGIGLTVAMQSFTVLDQLAKGASFGPVGEVRLMPDPASFAILPYAPKSARMYCDMVTRDGEPWSVCQRTALKRTITRARGMGFELKAAFENEFTLARAENGRFVPLDHSPCFSTIGLESAAAVMVDIIEALIAQGVQPEQCYAELGPGQQELPIRYADALRAADDQLTVRDTARAIAAKHGLLASFAPKPFPNEAGNGSHIHFSLWHAKTGTNAFHAAGRHHGLSDTALAFIGGVLHHAPALLALTAGSVNSYRRLQPQFWSSAYTAWGPDNKEATIRVPPKREGLEAKSTNLELKPADASANPYLALTGLLAAGLDGIERKLDPGPPALADPHTMSESERTRHGIRRYPTSLGEALDAFQRDDVLRAALGRDLAEEYLVVKRAEVAAFAERDEAFELAQHFYKY